MATPARKATEGKPHSAAPAPKPARDYWFFATRPLHVFVFLMPLLILYELGTIFFLRRAGAVEVIRAKLMLAEAFDALGPVGMHLPPFLLAGVLLAWHVISHDRWRLEPGVLPKMAGESVLWTVPLLVFGAIAGSRAMMAIASGQAPTELSTGAKVTLSIGAGVYEELLFRLILITVVHLVLVDLLKVKDAAALVIGAILSAAAFTLYHRTTMAPGAWDTRTLVMYAAAGLYFAVLFILRGLGIAVATHALYDTVALLLLPGRD